jgi:superfamily II DNA or RNA helicase
MIVLRDYQDQVRDEVATLFARHRRVLLVAPTGAGKTTVFADITRRAAAKGKTAYILVHRHEIVEQISDALSAVNVRHGRIQSGHSMTNDLVQVGMVNTVARRLDRIAEPALLVIDECHHAVAGTYDEITQAWQRCRVLGVTATPERLDGKGLSGAFDEMVQTPGVADLIQRGYLARFRYLAPPTSIDLSAVKTRMGDYAIGDLAAAMDKASITGSAVAHYQKYLGGRSAIAFCVTVAHAENVAQQFRDAGVRAASIDGTMDRGTRRELLAGLGDGRVQVLTSCSLISEGINIPAVAGAILLRPTESLALYLQSVGRALRPKSDGAEAVILDHVNNVARHGLPDAPRVWSLDAKKRKAKEPIGTTQCEVCYRVFSTTEPGWRDGETCREAEQPSDCALLPATAGAGGREAPEVVDGALMDVTAASAPVEPVLTPWSAGLCVVTGPYKQVVRLARTDVQLRELAQARGYSAGWVRRIMGFRQQHAGPSESESVPFVPVAAVAAQSVRAARQVDEMEGLLS